MNSDDRRVSMTRARALSSDQIGDDAKGNVAPLPPYLPLPPPLPLLLGKVRDRKEIVKEKLGARVGDVANYDDPRSINRACKTRPRSKRPMFRQGIVRRSHALG